MENKQAPRITCNNCQKSVAKSNISKHLKICGKKMKRDKKEQNKLAYKKNREKINGKLREQRSKFTYKKISGKKTYLSLCISLT
jgi:hypothetical protein